MTKGHPGTAGEYFLSLMFVGKAVYAYSSKPVGIEELNLEMARDEVDPQSALATDNFKQKIYHISDMKNEGKYVPRLA